jgi:hypothetical protein
MARPKTPVEQRLSEEWQQLYGELVPRLERLKRIEDAMRAMELEPPTPKPHLLLRLFAELAQPGKPQRPK